MTTSRTEEFDSIRGIAAVGVVWYHIRHQELFWYWTAMDLFFVLSSFLIGRLLEKKVTKLGDIPSFYLRRAVRLWPAYLIAVVVVYAVQLTFSLYGRGPQHSWEAIIRFVTFSQFTELYYLQVESWDYPTFAVHLWSLAIEEQFYILFPLALLAIRLLDPGLQAVVIIAGIAGGVVARSNGMHFYLLPHHLDAFMLGAGLAMAYPYLRQRVELFKRIFWVTSLCSLSVTAPYLWEGYSAYFLKMDVPKPSAVIGLAFNIFWVSMIGWVSLSNGASSIRWLRHPLPVYLGRVSYSLYLLHLPILRLGGVLIRDTALAFGIKIPGTVIGLLCLPPIFVAAHLLYRWVDRPLQEAGSSKLVSMDARLGSVKG